MLSRTIAVLAIATFTVTGMGDYAGAFDQTMPIRISLLKWGGNPTVGKLFKIVSKAPNPPLFSLPSGDPVTQGGSLTVLLIGGTGSTGSLTCDLQAGAWDGTRGWKALGNPEGSKGYKYKNKTAPTTDPCKIAIIKEKVIKVLAKGVGGITEPADSGNGDVSAVVTAGGDRYCAYAAATHDKEKASKLIKMKDQGEPAACPTCGDDFVNQLSETCDGTDDSACTCSGTCLPPDDPNECTCGSICGDDCVSGTEQCDGTEDDQCPGLCLANCTCPEPICNNGVKEVGEECDPAGSTADCPPGQICGGFCECVPDAACDCGSPDPSRYVFKDLAPVPGSVCGTADGDVVQDLECMGLYFGGGGGDTPLPSMAPDEANFKFNVSHCYGTNVTFEHTTPAQVTARDCTAGKLCSGGTNDGQPCVRDRHCPLGTCANQCYFASYLPLTNTALPPLGTCVGLEISEDSQGAVDCESGESFTRIPLDAVIHLPLLDQSPTTPGHQSCPICVGGTLNVPDSGTCSGGPNKQKPCMPMTTSYDLHDCCAGGSKNTWDCTDDSDCPGGSCVSGCTQYPTSLQCPPHPLSSLGPGLLLTLDLTTGVETATTDANGNFCGWCRDVDDEGSGCFEGDPDDGPPLGKNSCPDSSVLACRPATFYGPGGGDPADMVDCGDALPCKTNADCKAPYETCQQRSPGAWRDATVRNTWYEGSPAGDLRDHSAHPAEIMSFFCIPPNFDETIDGSSDVGGPGAISIIGESRLSPSGAFIDATPGLLD